jgi:hypothetical protein
MPRNAWGRTAGQFAVFTIAVLAVSCGGGDDFHRVYPVKGKILVDGNPAKDCQIQLNRTFDDTSDKKVYPNAVTDEKGEFQITSYVSGDGAPEGEYVITIEWKERSGLLKNNFDGPDRLGGEYANKDQNKVKPGFLIKVGKEPLELPPFQLKQSAAGKRKADEYRKKPGPILGGDR